MEFFRWNIFKNETNRTSNCWLGSDRTAAADNKWNKLPARCKNSCRYLPVVTEEIRIAISHNLTLRPRNWCRGRTFCQTHVLASPNFEARFQAALQQSFCIVAVKTLGNEAFRTPCSFLKDAVWNFTLCMQFVLQAVFSKRGCWQENAYHNNSSVQILDDSLRIQQGPQLLIKINPNWDYFSPIC